MVEIYTDGACKMSTRDGGWAMVVVKDDQVIHEDHSIAKETTNNIMELTAFLNGLSYALTYALMLGEEVTIYSDSKYCVDGYNSWCHNWEKKGWKTSTKKKVLNLDLWVIIHQLRSPLVKAVWVEGHSGNKWNEYCDGLTRGYEK